eukprot:SAG31_NODE_2242_length_6109_cov_18.408819_7_plen_99_part_00
MREQQVLSVLVIVRNDHLSDLSSNIVIGLCGFSDGRFQTAKAPRGNDRASQVCCAKHTIALFLVPVDPDTGAGPSLPGGQSGGSMIAVSLHTKRFRLT